MRLLWTDTETGGLEAGYHEMLTIAGIIEIDKKVVDEFYYKIKPNFPERLQDGALKVNGLTREEVMTFEDSGVVFNRLKTKFIKYGVDGAVFGNRLVGAGHNVGFDKGFLNAFFTYHKCDTLYYWLDYHHMDTMSVAAWLRYCGLLDVKNLKLETLCKHFNIPLKAHDALEDIRATKLLAVELFKMVKGMKNA